MESRRKEEEQRRRHEEFVQQTEEKLMEQQLKVEARRKEMDEADRIRQEVIESRTRNCSEIRPSFNNRI